MKSNNYILGILLLIFTGCFSQNKNIKTAYDTSTEGMIVGTICIEHKSYSSYSFVYQDTRPAVADYANINDELTFKNLPGDFKEKGKTYYLFSIVKPEGNYKFSKLKIFDNGGNETVSMDIPLKMIQFKVEKGKTTYFGQLTVNVKDKKYIVENQLDRDKEWFNKKAPQIQF